MSQPLTDQRQRAELIAELYDLHAAGLFAYCADQLGDLGSASDVLVAVLGGVPAATAPPRAALYAFARREIHRRDVVYAPPAVDPLIDPATALVERSLRELRPHQREVLVLCAVCGLSKAELAWVLDVAPDTAEELAVGAGHRFRQSLGAALASTGIRVPKPVADVYGALGVAPLRDVLGRLPWPQPPGALRIHFAGSRTAAPAPLFVKPRWPSPPVWPQPLAEADPATSTVIFPTELLTPPSSGRVAEHEATTAPMPKLRDGMPPPRDILDPGLPLHDAARPAWQSGLPARDPGLPLRDPRVPLRDPGVPLRDPLGEAPRERPFFMAAPEPTAAEPFATGDVILPKDAPDPYMTGDVLVHKGPARPLPPPGRAAEGGDGRRLPPLDPQPAPEEFLRETRPEIRSEPRREAGAGSRRPSRAEEPVRAPAAPLFQPREKPAAEPVYRLPERRENPKESHRDRPEPRKGPKEARKGEAGDGFRDRVAGSAASSVLAPRPVRARPAPKRRPESARPPKKTKRRKDRHHDWVWEVAGFLLCVAIAMIVFFSMPIFVDP
ncbi:RNA polymerase sigma factor [Nonomuraea candida]|uniref:RNA polymerase sigma factor n=1 Tax=Nonomuraea candida TaxID=359159 RepID=UPI0005B87713|nr:hypothetical protein [Nonomuraea candida]